MNAGVLALLLAAAAVAGILLGVRIQAREDARGARVATARGRDLWLPASLLALVVAFLGIVTWIAAGALGRWADRDHLLVRHPVGEIRITEEPGGGAEWRGARGIAAGAMGVDAGAGGRRGRDRALRVRLDLAGPADTTVVQVSGADLPDGIGVATVWVYVEDTDAAQGAGLHARLAGRMNAGSNGSYSLVGERTPLAPGAWTEVAWAGSYTLELSPALGGDSTGDRRVHASDRLTSLGVRLDADGPYRGPVFVDDLRAYAAGTAPPP
jgi:hypothetical protein